MRHKYDVATIEQAIAALGGDTAVANWLDITQGAVGNWKLRGAISPGWHLRIYARLRSMGLTVSPAVFGLTEEEAAGLFVDAVEGNAA